MIIIPLVTRIIVSRFDHRVGLACVGREAEEVLVIIGYVRTREPFAGELVLQRSFVGPLPPVASLGRTGSATLGTLGGLLSEQAGGNLGLFTSCRGIERTVRIRDL